MSKYILLSRPVEIETWCTECKDDTEQIVKFMKYEAHTHIIHYVCKCTKCKSSFQAQANVKYWISVVCQANNGNEN